MAKNDPAGLVGGAGLLTRIFTDLNECVVSRGGTADDIHRLTKPEGRVIIEEIADVIVRRSRMIRVTVQVNRLRTPQEVLDATRRRQYTDPNVVATMPRGEGEKVEVVFFSLGCLVSDAELVAAYKKYGLKPDPYAQAAVNEQDPAFADGHPNGTYWQRPDGGYNYLIFYRGVGERYVHVGRGVDGWVARWWFSGVDAS